MQYTMGRQCTRPTMTRAIRHADIGKDTSTHARNAGLTCSAHAHGHHGRGTGHGTHALPCTCTCTQRAPPRAHQPPRPSRRRHHAHAHADIRHNTRATQQACSPRMSQPGAPPLTSGLRHSRLTFPSPSPRTATAYQFFRLAFHGASLRRLGRRCSPSPHLASMCRRRPRWRQPRGQRW